MDTTWFAVDRDGHVAAFDSHNAGAVPNDAFIPDDGCYGLLKAIRDRVEASAAVYELDGRLVEPVAAHVSLPLDDEFEHVLMFLQSLDVVTAALSSGTAREVRARPAKAVIWKPLPEDEYERLHAIGACLFCDYTDEEEQREYAWPNAAKHGLYRYEHAYEDWVAGAYTRRALPTNPVHADDLPREVMAHAVRFDGSFAETAAIQPVELWPSRAYGAAWLSSDGKRVEALPGRDDDYAAFYENRKHSLPSGKQLAPPKKR